MTIAELLCAAYVALALPNADTACENMNTVVDAAEKYDVEPSVMVSLIFVESRWSPRAVSRDGACGLTQILPRYTAGFRNRFGKKLTCKQLFDSETSIRRGTKILSSYNAGPRRCRRGIAKNKGHRYAKKVLRIAKSLRKEMREIEEDEGYANEDVPGCYE